MRGAGDRITSNPEKIVNNARAMAKITKHVSGMFSWADLSTSEPETAKAFYTTLFGWHFEDYPAGEGRVYSMARIDNEDVAALYAQSENDRDKRIPSHWTCYHSVDDIEAQAKRVSLCGGKLLAPPFDVFDAGKMCVLSEPSGAVSALWQPQKRIGATLMGEHGTIGWAELLSRDPDASKRFLSELHGFKALEMPLTGEARPYTVFSIGEKPSCGLLAMPEGVPPEVPSHWRPYFNVDDCDATIQAALAAGGKQISPVVEVPNVGRFAALQDPQGAIFEVIRPTSQKPE